MDLREIGLGGCRLDSTGWGQGPVAACGECGDESSGYCATELVIKTVDTFLTLWNLNVFFHCMLDCMCICSYAVVMTYQTSYCVILKSWFMAMHLLHDGCYRCYRYDCFLKVNIVCWR
jgi:hypothetical protein